ncbi:transcriptional regulator [Pseudomonas sp. SWRI74]|uniref:Transcriptional regulator n=1 Tax=Pseudomonas azerbaijanoccidentalis TaxID=2842347 RepID=A0ABS6QQA4_9PSED|nr:histone-like nucleoid-structuring protein, MvaT/MvaU family [Pseudomonas azerbaijanoccidentalis]MBV4521119.1 transcriptional regulator [Pseudomonas azerbaijanoccidentalis]
MSKLAQFRQLEKHLTEQLLVLESLKGDADLKKEIEFETKLRDLLANYGYSLKDIINLLDPQRTRSAGAIVAKAGLRRRRQVRVYRNPHTGERVETKSENNKTLKEWKTRHGADTVESWLKK